MDKHKKDKLVNGIIDTLVKLGIAEKEEVTYVTWGDNVSEEDKERYLAQLKRSELGLFQDGTKKTKYTEEKPRDVIFSYRFGDDEYDIDDEVIDDMGYISDDNYNSKKR